MPDTSSITLTVEPSSWPLLTWFSTAAGGKDVLGAFTLDFFTPFCSHLLVIATFYKQETEFLLCGKTMSTATKSK